MIAYWRRQFAAPQLPFFYVLLAAGHTAVMREAQAQGAGPLGLSRPVACVQGYSRRGDGVALSQNGYVLPHGCPRALKKKYVRGWSGLVFLCAL